MKGRGGLRPGAGRKGGWQSGETQTIRVPTALKGDLLALGRQLDQGEGVIGGRLRRDLDALVIRWREQSADRSEGDWPAVGQLLDELETLVDSRGCGGGHRHRRRCRDVEGQVYEDAPESAL